MKFLTVAFAALICLTGTASAQDRTLGAREIVLDNGAGGKLTIKYNGTGHDTIYFGNGGGSGGSMPAGNNSQTLRHDGETFVVDSNLLNDGEQVRFGGGVRYAIRSITSNDSLTALDHIVVATADGHENLTLKMPVPSVGRQVTIRFINECGDCSGELQLLPNTEETIEGDSDYWLSEGFENAATFASDGTDWYRVGTVTSFFF